MRITDPRQDAMAPPPSSRFHVVALIMGVCLVVLSSCAMRGSASVEHRDAHPAAIAGSTRPTAMGPGAVGPAAVATTSGSVTTICSFNIQFLGSSATRDCAALATVVAGYDIVVVQELVAPPVDGRYPDGTSYHADPEAAAFVAAMHARGFDAWLSEEDTGTGDTLHRGGTATEWFITFYKPDRVHRAEDLPHGFLAVDRSNHPDFERVPYAFAFRTATNDADVVLISVHLKPDPGPVNRERRRHELQSIAAWVTAHDQQEHDFVILGDMNIESPQELATVQPAGWDDLNAACLPTNTNVRSPKPYDHVLYRHAVTTEIGNQADFRVLSLVDLVRPSWTGPGPFPGGPPYHHDAFRVRYSDHNPVVFTLRSSGRDDD